MSIRHWFIPRGQGLPWASEPGEGLSGGCRVQRTHTHTLFHLRPWKIGARPLCRHVGAVLGASEKQEASRPAEGSARVGWPMPLLFWFSVPSCDSALPSFRAHPE